MSGSLKILLIGGYKGSCSEGFVWVLDLFPFSRAVPFFASLVRLKAGTETFRRLAIKIKRGVL